MAFVGMLNGTGTDRSAAFSLEQAIIPGLVPDTSRTWGLAWYNVVLDTAGSLGALAVASPLLLQNWLALPLLTSYRVVFFGCALLGVVAAGLYLFASPAVELSKPSAEISPHHISPTTKKVVAKLTGLFALDAFGGGFLTDALVAYWFFRRFGVPEQSLGVLFFAVHLLNAASHLGAAWLARRIGLVNTMVFTHLPSSLFLVAAAFAPSLKVAVVLFLCREALVEMDVPTRQSYVAAVVLPNERTFASGVTNLARNVFWAIGSSVAGFFMQNVAFSAPLVVGGGAKITYDLILYRAFRKLRPPEEHETS
jgi:Major Facilitator Superfamily